MLELKQGSLQWKVRWGWASWESLQDTEWVAREDYCISGLGAAEIMGETPVFLLRS
jgi:hypothetical protein